LRKQPSIEGPVYWFGGAQKSAVLRCDIPVSIIEVVNIEYVVCVRIYPETEVQK
jgi:hypothetical protein